MIKSVIQENESYLTGNTNSLIFSVVCFWIILHFLRFCLNNNGKTLVFDAVVAVINSSRIRSGYCICVCLFMLIFHSTVLRCSSKNVFNFYGEFFTHFVSIFWWFQLLLHKKNICCSNKSDFRDSMTSL